MAQPATKRRKLNNEQTCDQDFPPALTNIDDNNDTKTVRVKSRKRGFFQKTRTYKPNHSNDNYDNKKPNLLNTNTHTMYHNYNDHSTEEEEDNDLNFSSEDKMRNICTKLGIKKGLHIGVNLYGFINHFTVYEEILRLAQIENDIQRDNVIKTYNSNKLRDIKSKIQSTGKTGKKNEMIHGICKKLLEFTKNYQQNKRNNNNNNNCDIENNNNNIENNNIENNNIENNNIENNNNNNYNHNDIEIEHEHKTQSMTQPMAQSMAQPVAQSMPQSMPQFDGNAMDKTKLNFHGTMVDKNRVLEVLSKNRNEFENLDIETQKDVLLNKKQIDVSLVNLVKRYTGSNGVKCDGCGMTIEQYKQYEGLEDEDLWDGFLRNVCPDCKYGVCEYCEVHNSRGTCYCKNHNFGNPYHSDVSKREWYQGGKVTIEERVKAMQMMDVNSKDVMPVIAAVNE